jgi:anti-sigma B factor antagonist
VAPNTIEVEQADGVSVVVVIGEHDLSTVDRLREQLESARASRAPVVVDLSAATFIDSAVIGVLVGEHDRSLAEGVGFALAVTESSGYGVHRILNLAGLDAVLPVALGREQALAAVRA